MLKVKVSGIDSARMELDRQQEIIERTTQKKVDEIGSLMRKNISEEIRVHHPKKGPWYGKTGKPTKWNYYHPGGTSGRYWRSIKSKTELLGKKTTSSVYTTSPHSIYVELGSKRHEIKPVRKKILRWIPQSGIINFRKRVMHPGYRGDDIFNRAYIEWGIGAPVRISNAIERAILSGSLS